MTMKKLLLVAVAIIVSFTAFSQDPPYFDDFDDQIPGNYIAEEIPDWWTTWSNDPGSAEDAVFSDNPHFIENACDCNVLYFL